MCPGGVGLPTERKLKKLRPLEPDPGHRRRREGVGFQAFKK